MSSPYDINVNDTGNGTHPLDNIRSVLDLKSQRSLLPSQQITFIIALTISLVGLVGNIFTVLVLKLHKPKSVYIFFLQMLAVADGLVMFFTIVAVSLYLNSSFPSIRVRTALSACHDVAQFTSTWVLVTASLDRYLAFNNPFKKGCMKGCTQKKALGIVLSIVLVAVLLEIPRMVVVPREHQLLATIINFVFRYFVPLIILAYVNCRLVFYVRQVEQDHNELTRKATTDQNRTRSATIMLIVVVFIFLVCSMTRGLSLVIQLAVRLGAAKKPLNLTTWILMLINSAINFVVYVMFYQKFRQNVKNIFQLCYKKKRGHANLQSTNMQSRYRTAYSSTGRLSLTTQTIL